MSRYEKFRILQDSMLEATEAEQLHVSRAMPYGMAASALAILFAMTQVQSRAIDAQIAIAAATVCLPIALIQAAIYEFYLYLGKESYVHFQTATTQQSVKRSGYLAGTALVVSVGALVHVLLPWATWVFAGSVALAFWMLHSFNADLASWWQVKLQEKHAQSGA